MVGQRGLQEFLDFSQWFIDYDCGGECDECVMKKQVTISGDGNVNVTTSLCSILTQLGYLAK